MTVIKKFSELKKKQSFLHIKRLYAIKIEKISIRFCDFRHNYEILILKHYKSSVAFNTAYTLQFKRSQIQ